MLATKVTQKYKTLGKAAQKNHRRVAVPKMQIEELEKAFDEIAITHPPPGFDIPYDWRNIGITINMLKVFWTSRPNDLHIIVRYKGNKIEELKTEKYNNGSISTLVLDAFADHAMFFKNNKHGASQSKLYKNDDEEPSDDEFMSITVPTISKSKPHPYSKWLSFEEFTKQFEEITCPKGEKRTSDGKLKNIERTKIYVKGDMDMLEAKNIWWNKTRKHTISLSKRFMERH